MQPYSSSQSSPMIFIYLLLITLAIFTPVISATRSTSSEKLNYYSTLSNIPLISTNKITELTVNIPYNQETLIELSIDSTYPYQVQYLQQGVLFKLKGSANKFYINSKEIFGTEITIYIIGKMKLFQQQNGDISTYSVDVIPLQQKYVCAFDCYGNGECQSDNQCICNGDYMRDTYCEKKNENAQQKEEKNRTSGNAHQLFRRSPGVSEQAFNEIFSRNEDRIDFATNNHQEPSKQSEEKSTAQNDFRNNDPTIIPEMNTVSLVEAQPAQTSKQTIELRDQRNRRTLQNSQVNNSIQEEITQLTKGFAEFSQQSFIVLVGILAIGIITAMIILLRLKKQSQYHSRNSINNTIIDLI